MKSPLIIFLRGITGYCPHCGQQRIFSGVIAMHPQCPNCKLQFENKPGDFTGAAYLNSGISGFIGVTIGFLAILMTDYSATTVLAALIPFIVVLASLLHQPIKGTWVALMYYTEAIKPPDNITKSF